MDYSRYRYLIFDVWETPTKIGGGSHVVGGAFTEDEAKKKIVEYEKNRPDVKTLTPYDPVFTWRYAYVRNHEYF